MIKKYDLNNDGKIDLNEYLKISMDKVNQNKVDEETSQEINTGTL